jgi:hypothetical protein
VTDTARPLSETAIANMAAGILDEYTLLSLDDDTPVGRMMAREFGYVRDELLAAYPWAFALSRTLLAVDPVAPAFEWAYRFRLPTDCLRILPLTVNGALGGSPVDFEREGPYLLTNSGGTSGLRIRYIKREVDPQMFDVLFARAFAARLAMLAATRITGKAQYYTKAQGEFEQAMWEARKADSLTRGSHEFVLSPWATETPGSTISVRGVGL